MTHPIERSRLFWRLQFAGWAAYSLLGATFAGIVYFNLLDALEIIFCRTVFGFLATCGLRLLYRVIRPRPVNLWLAAGGVFLLCGGVAFADGGFIWGAALLLGVDFGQTGARQFLVPSIFMRWMVYWVWSLLYFIINFWLDTQHAKLLRARTEAEARTSELRFLQAQINPHFLFNALNTILAETDNPQTRAITQALAEYLRFSLRQHGESEPLGVELDALEHYLEVEKARFQEKLVYAIEASPEARRTHAPVASVQPLLENAVKYGRRTSPALLKLEVTAWVADALLHVKIRNSGHWIPPEGNASTQTGLDNLRRRLALLYGGKATLCLAHDDHGVSAELCLPALGVPAFETGGGR